MTVVLIKRNQREQTAASPFTVGHFVHDIRLLKPTANIHLMPRSSVSVCWRFVSPPASAACWANQTDQTSLSKRSFCVFVCRPSRVTQSSVWFVIRDNERRPNLPGVPAPATTGWHHSSETDVWSHAGCISLSCSLWGESLLDPIRSGTCCSVCSWVCELFALVQLISAGRTQGLM